MFNGKMKAVTFSYDDGVLQDEQVIRILNKYNLKGTFNLNSDLLGKEGSLRINENITVDHTKIKPELVKSVYFGHEVAAHTLTHPTLTALDEKEIIHQVEDDRTQLSKLVGYEVCGMAYPNGGVNNDDRVADIIKRNSKIEYARTITSSYSFDLQSNLYRFNPTVYNKEWDKLWELIKEFVDLKTDKPALLYIWGHSYEFDYAKTWDMLEDVCKALSNRDDIYYGTNKEILLSR